MHVVNGDSVARSLRQARAGEPVIVWRDVLHEGPVPPGDPAAVRSARAAFLAQAGFGSVEDILADLEAADRALIAALDTGVETVLWFEHDLHDQLQLIQILARIAEHPDRGVVRLISIGAFPGHARFMGLGELSADELASLWPQRRPIEDEALATATRAYDAFRRGNQPALAALTREPLPGLPYLSAALGRLLEDRPWCGPGLGRSEREILRAVAEGARTPSEVFTATQAMEEAPFAGDSWVFRRIDDLAARGLLVSEAGRLSDPGA